MVCSQTHTLDSEIVPIYCTNNCYLFVLFSLLYSKPLSFGSIFFNWLDFKLVCPSYYCNLDHLSAASYVNWWHFFWRHLIVWLNCPPSGPELTALTSGHMLPCTGDKHRWNPAREKMSNNSIVLWGIRNIMIVFSLICLFYPTTTSWLCKRNLESHDWMISRSFWLPSSVKRVCLKNCLCYQATCFGKLHFTYPLGYSESCSLLLLGECRRQNKSLCLLISSHCALLPCSNTEILWR